MGTFLRRTPALLDVVACLVEAEGPVWGLRVSLASGRPTGTVYPLLERLERSALAASWWEDEAGRPGPRRRLYALNDAGRAWAGQQLAATGRAAGARERSG